MDERELQRTLDDDRAEWHALTAELDAAPNVSEHAGEWNSRDVYAHLARWMTVSTGDIEALHEVAPIGGSDDEINERWHAEDQRLPFDEARRRAHAAFERRIQVLVSAPLDRIDTPAIERAIRADGAEHYRAHRRQKV